MKGRRLKPVSWSGTRCSTDMVRQALFNILGPDFQYDNLSILDCFAGSGVVALEFISRGAKSVQSIDCNQQCYQYMQDIKSSLSIINWEIIRSKVNSKFIERGGDFDVVFADPPYADDEIERFVDSVLSQSILKKSGIFVLEHSSRLQFDRKELYKTKKYGESCLSFYQKE
jgi:16S rRNA (guanine966-N2)-methyltransferase